MLSTMRRQIGWKDSLRKRKLLQQLKVSMEIKHQVGMDSLWQVSRFFGTLLNSTLIALIPKKVRASEVKDYRLRAKLRYSTLCSMR
jgi:hypothetical protein